jgi:CO/xanthine dehydrogenase FAD-binding subunit
VKEAFAPATLQEALEIRRIRASHPEAVPIAGGTDLVVEVNARRLRPAAFLDRSSVRHCRSAGDVPRRHAVSERPGLGPGSPELMKAR